jgi:hypothetical protein
VINKQLKDDYDIFVGIMWSRFGSPTNRETSGTKEEFERAFNRNQSNEDVSLMFYFKNAPISIDEINTDQITKIKSFKEDLKNRGMYYGHFTQTDEFEKIFRLNLTQLLNDFSSKNLNSNSHTTVIEKEAVRTEDENKISVIEEEEELGMFDYIDNTEQYMKDIQNTLSKVVKYMNDLTTGVTKKTAKLTIINTKPQDVRIREARKLIDHVAEDLLVFNQRTRIELSVLNDQFSYAIKNYNNVLLIYKTLNAADDDKNRISESIYKLKDAISGAMDGIESMKKSVLETPSMTSKYAKAKKETGKLLTEITEDFASYINMTEELEKIISG